MSRIRLPGVSTASNNVPRCTLGRPRVQAEPLRAVVRVIRLLPLRPPNGIYQRDRRPLSCFGLIEALLREGITRGDLVVGGDLSDPEVVVGEDFVAALLLDFVVAHVGAPADQRLLIPPVREREYPPFSR